MTKRKSTPKRVNKNQESYFDAERILDEKKVNGKWLYLIKWSGHDRNGKPWSPDWQPKDNCTQMLLKEWEQEKLRQRKRQEEQKNKENQKEKENREESNRDGNVVLEDRSVDLQDDKADNKVQMDIDKPDNRIIEDNLKQVLDKYCCQNINDDIKRNSQTTIAKKELDPSRKIIKSLSFPASKVKLIKISPIQPTFANNLPIKSSISIVESGNTVDVFNKSSNKHICGKSYSIPSKSGRVSLFNLNKRGLEDYNNNLTTIKRQRTEDVYDVNRKIQNEKVEESRNSTTSNVKNKKIPSSTNGSFNKISSDGNLTNSQTVPIYNVPSSQISNQVHVGAIHVNSETIRALNSRKNSYSSMTSKLRPIASKSLQTTSSQHNGHNTGSSNSSNAVNVHSSSSTGKWSSSGSNASSSRQNSLSSKLASIKNPVSVAKIGASSGSSQVDKNVPTSTTSAHTSYFHKSYVQSTNYIKPYQTLQSVDNQNDQTMEKVSTPNKQPLTSSTSERSNQQQQFSNLQSSNIGDSTMDDNPFYQLPLERLKEPTVTNIDLWMNEWIKVKTLNDTLEKEKLDLIKEKNKYYREASQFKLEVEKRPQSDSEAAIMIKRNHESIAKMSNKWVESQSKYVNKCNEFEKLESEYSKLRSEYNQVKKIVMNKHAEVETLKGDINEKIQELKDLEEENNRLKSDWSRIVRNGVISMREDYQKITRLQNSFQDLINQRNKINIEINRMRETISQEINNMKEEDFDDDDEEYDNLYQQIENLKLQNKLQETSLRMAEENSKIAEESAKLMLDLKKLTVDETLKKYDVPSTVSFSNSQASSSSSSSSLANLLTKNNNTTSSNNNTAKQSQNRDNQSGNIRRMSGNAETRSVQSNSAQGHVNTNTNILQARNLTTVPTVRNNLGFGNQNISRSQTTVVKENSRRLSASSINPAHTVQSKDAAHSLGVRRSSTTTTVPMEMNVRPSTLTTEKFKVTRMTTNPIPKNPTKSTQQMNYFCEWNLCRRLFDDKIELKKHLKEDHFNSG